MGKGKSTDQLKRLALRAIVIFWASGGCLASGALSAQTPISIELVLAVDVSRSVDDHEFDLQMTGIAEAFRHPEIVTLIGRQEGVAVALFQWSSDIDEQYLIPWHLLQKPDSIYAFADKVERAERNPLRGFTGIGRAIDFGVRMITENEFAGHYLKIDVSGDGRDNIGTMPPTLWLQASNLGIVINGLPILVDTFHLDRYYSEKVIAGPGAFVEIAVNYDDFADAFLRKLRREVTNVISRDQENSTPALQEASSAADAPQ